VNIAEANTTGASMAGIVNFCNVETMLPPSRRFLALADWDKGREVSANFRLIEWEHIKTRTTCTDTSVYSRQISDQNFQCFTSPLVLVSIITTIWLNSASTIHCSMVEFLQAY
jgi:hypothetical protein